MNKFINKKWWIIFILISFISIFLVNISNIFIYIGIASLTIGIIDGWRSIKKLRWLFYISMPFLIYWVVICSIIISLNKLCLQGFDRGMEKNTKELQITLKEYADKHSGIYPDNLLELQAYFPKLILYTAGYKYTKVNDNQYCLYTELETRKDVFFANEKEVGFGNSNCTKK